MNELLSICIPTRNRYRYLSELLLSIERELDIINFPEGTIRTYIADNASSDKTPEIVDSYKKRNPFLFYFRNSQNIGGDKNFLHCINLAKGKYIWLVGDDELINKGALFHILNILNQKKPVLFINNDGSSNDTTWLPISFDSYAACIKYFVKTDPFFPIEHSLITCNIFSRSSFDYAFAEKMIHTHYGHMYGLASGMLKNPGLVFVTNVKTIIIRKIRASFEKPIALSRFEEVWTSYLEWLKLHYGIEELNPKTIVSEQIAKMQGPVYFEHPFLAFLREKLKSLYLYLSSSYPCLKPFLRILKTFYREYLGGKRFVREPNDSQDK